MSLKKEVYLDTAATTKPDPQVLIDFVKYADEFPYNPSSIHDGGMKAKNQLTMARKKIANIIGCRFDEIIFTSGGTESNNIAIRGFFENKNSGVLITTQIEHPSVLRIAECLEKKNYHVYYLPANEGGIISINDLEDTIQYWIDRGMDPKNILVSIQGANNEIGTIQYLESIYRLTKMRGVFLHSDQVQLFPHSGPNMHCDAFTVSGHKFGALRGTGFVYISKELQQQLSPIILGGGQEFGMRSGTENVAGCCVLANRVQNYVEYLKKYGTNLLYEQNKFSKKLKDKLTAEGIEYRFNGYRDIPVYSLTLFGIEADSLISLLSERGFYISAGSSCHSYNPEPSHVLKAIGMSDEEARSTIRFCWNEELENEAIDEFLEQLCYFIKLLRGKY